MILLMLVGWLGLGVYYVVESYGMERGAIVRAPILKGDITARTLAGYLSIYHAADHLGRARSFALTPFAWKADHNWGGGFYVHFGRKHHPSHPSEYSEIRMPLVVPILFPFLVLTVARHRSHWSTQKRQAAQVGADP